MGKNQHVVPKGKDWAVKGAGNSKATKVTPTQAKAIDAAKKIAKTEKSEVVIHDQKGRIRDIWKRSQPTERQKTLGLVF